MRRLTALGLAFALATAAVTLASCGGGDDAQLLPGAEAREITANLDAVEQLANEGECSGAAEAAEQVSVQVETLEGVDEELQQALERGAARLNEVVDTCEEETTEEELVPVPEPSEDPDEDEEKEREKEEKKREREEEKAAKEEERKEKEDEPAPPAQEVEPPEEPSGGISPSDAVEEDDEGDD